MAHGQVTVPVAGELRSVATDGRTVATDSVYDYNLQKTQEQINQELYNGAGGGSSTPVDAYTKAQSDSKYATKTEVNTVSGTVNTLSSNVNNITSTVNQMASSPNNKPTINKTWAEMIALKNSNGFIPGQTYRITDYLTTGNTSAVYGLYSYAGHPFDVIVTALTENTLDEDAKAAKRAGDTYFANCKLNAWKLKYLLDPANDSRFPQSLINSQTKGWIYYMEDEHFNSANYDFKNILTQGVRVTDFKYKDFVGSSTNGTVGSPYLKYIISTMKDQDTWEDALGGVYTVDANSTKLFYLFSYLKENGSVIDSSVEGVQNSYPTYNRLSETSPGSKPSEPDSQTLLPQINLFISDWEFATGTLSWQEGGGLPAHNTFGQRTTANTFGNSCIQNTFFDWSNCNVFGNYFRANVFNNNVRGSVFGNNATANIVTRDLGHVYVGCNFQENTICRIINSSIGNDFYLNQVTLMQDCTIGESCAQNVFPANTSSCTIGNRFELNEGSGWLTDSTIGDVCRMNDFDTTDHITLGDSCMANTFNRRCAYITMGDYCQNNIFDGGNQYIVMGDRCYANHFDSQVQYIVFGSSTEDVKGFYYGNVINSYNDHIALNATSTLSTSNRFTGIRIDTKFYAPRITDSSASSYTYKVINNNEINQQYSTTYTNPESKVLNA